MTDHTPTTALDPQYSDANAKPEDWAEARAALEAAPIFWISTVRPDGRPHVTPLICVWHYDALYICTGEQERKGRNLAENDACVLTTGNNAYVTGIDYVVEGHAVRVRDETELIAVAAVYLDKYGEDWRFEVVEGDFEQGGHRAAVFRIAPEVVFGFRRGQIASQTKWTFQ
jgi:hypothetical protein